MFLLLFRFSQAISAPHPIAIIGHNQIYQESLASPRLAALQRELEAGYTSALENFWQEVTKQGTPLVEPIKGESRYVWLTFLWRAKEALRRDISGKESLITCCCSSMVRVTLV
jgi:hypothetical protein